MIYNAAVIARTFALIVTIFSFIGCQNDPTFDPQFICSYPEYKLISNNLTEEETLKILGEPNKIVKSDKTENGLGQGNNGTQINEGWIYSFSK